MRVGLNKNLKWMLSVLFIFVSLNISNPVDAQSASSTAAPYFVGQCWQVDVAKNVPSHFWNGAGPVTCQSPHNGYTYAMIILPSNYPDPYKKKYSTQEQSIIDKLWLNRPNPLDQLLGTTRVQFSFYFPTQAQWAVGQRWERADLGLANFGSPYSNAGWAPLPADAKTLIAGLKKDIPEFNMCTITPKVTDLPDGVSAVWADCRANPMHRYLGGGNIASTPNEKFPGVTIANQRAIKVCSTFAKDSAVVMAYSAVATAVDWNQGNRRVWCWQDFVNGLALVQKGMKWGYIDKMGKYVIPLQFDYAYNFADGVALVQKGSKWGGIDNTGKYVIPLQFDYAYNFADGVALVQKGKKWGYIDKTGKYLIPLQFDDAFDFVNGMALAKKGTKWGYINKTGKYVIPPQFENVDGFADGVSLVQKGSKWGGIDKTGKYVIPLQFDYAYGFADGVALVQKGSKWGGIDKTGKYVFPLQFDAVKNFVDGFAAVLKGNKWVYIDKTGKTVNKP